MRWLSRRRALRALCSAVVAGPAWGVRSGAASGRRDLEERFDPAKHGFGFRNWSTAAPTYPEHDHDTVSESDIRRTIKRDWREPANRLTQLDVTDWPDALVDLIARQLYVAVNQQSATNGHCYGMVFAAQQYYERPDTLPSDRASASRLEHPVATTPGGDAIDGYQIDQFLSAYAWLGRRRMVLPRRVDYEREHESATAAIEEHGSAGLTLFSRESKRSHQVLAYDYRTDSNGADLDVYDPNFAASFYDRNPGAHVLRVGTGEGGASVQFAGYDGFVHNRWDRSILARGGEAPIDRDRRANLRSAASRLALFLVDSPDVSVIVTGPNDRPVRRRPSPHADQERTEYHAARYRYGATPGEYRIAVIGRDPGEYTLTASAADRGGERLNGSVTASIEPGAVHEYVAAVPDDGEGRLRPDSDGDGVGTLGALGGAALVGAAAYAYGRRTGE